MTSETLASDLSLSPIALSDSDELTKVMNALTRFEEGEEHFQPESAEEVRHWLARDDFDLERDSVGVRSDGLLIAYGAVEIAPELTFSGHARVRVNGGVHPKARRRGVGTLVMERLEARARALVAEHHPGAPAYIEAMGWREGSSSRPMLEGRGYRHVRDYIEMERDVSAEMPLVDAPDGIDVIAPADDDGARMLEAHNLAFADHWGSAPMPAERWQHYWTGPAARHDLSTLAVDADGRALGYILAEMRSDAVLYLALVGTVPEARGQGLARAMIARTLEAARADGRIRTAELEVDADSLTGATRLYEAMGFAPFSVMGSYALEL